jgi:hypothetical protein
MCWGSIRAEYATAASPMKLFTPKKSIHQTFALNYLHPLLQLSMHWPGIEKKNVRITAGCFKLDF